MSDLQQIGVRIHKYRQALSMSVAELAKQTGLSPERVEDFEAGRASASIGIMMKIARALGQRVGTFVDDLEVADPVICRGSERERSLAAHRKSDEGQYCYYSLGSGKSDRHMEPFFVRISSGHSPQLSSHEGEEFVVVLSGQVELLYGEETHLLGAGDSVYYNSVVPHSLAACAGDAEVYGVIYNS